MTIMGRLENRMAKVAKTRGGAASRPGRNTQEPYHHGALRDALLEVAESVLLDFGVEGFTLRECARRAGVSHGAPAHHFGDARGLLSELTAASFEQLEALMRTYRAKAPPDGYSQFGATGLAYVDYALAHRARFQLMFRSDRMDHSNQRLLDAGKLAYAHLEETLRLVTSEAHPPSAGLEAKIALAWSLVHGFSTLMLDNRQFAALIGDDPSRPHRVMADLLLRMRGVFEAAEPARESAKSVPGRR
jgi:AcrR family transcriptional regulator